jgi:nucleoid-associated protein YgaU
MDPRLWTALGLTAATAGAVAGAWLYVAQRQPLAPVRETSAPAVQAVEPPPSASAVAPAVSSAPAVQSAAPPAPAFDVVRVERDGSALVAGRAAPNAEVTLLLNGQPAGAARADDAGNFVLMPPPLPPGAHVLSLSSVVSGALVPSQQVVNVVGADAATGRPMVALAQPGAPTRILSDAAPEPHAGLSIRAVEAEQGGAFYASGQAAPDRVVRLYLNGAMIAETPTRPDGAWSVRIEKGMTPGPYAVRADELAKDGKVLGRAEVAYVYPAPAKPEAAQPTPNQPATAGAAPTDSVQAKPADASVPEVSTATVARGDSLWSLSTRIYGSGFRYTEIYGANAAQIRNPDLIYPGQVLVAPKAGPRG